MFIKKVRKTLKKYNMLSAKERVLVGVSGGPDSVALLHALYRLKEDFGIEIFIGHLNHMFRPKDSNKAENFVKNLAEELGLPFTSKRVNVPQYMKDEKLSAQEAAREVRYCFFIEEAKKSRVAKIAKGHNADDQAETVLMRIIKGSGSRGLGGIPPVRDNKFIRPLIETTREEINDFLKENNLDSILDPSNKETIYLRNQIRIELIPALQKEYNPKIKEELVHLSAIMRDEEAYLDKIVEEVLSKVLLLKNKNRIEIDIKSLARLDLAIQRRIIGKAMKCLCKKMRGVSFRHFSDILELIYKRTSGRSLNLPGGLIAKKEYQNLILTNDSGDSRTDFDYSVKVPCTIDIETKGASYRFDFKIKEIKDIVKDFKSNKNRYCVFLDFDKAGEELVVRNRRPGDRFRPFGMSGTKKLKEYFIDEKIPISERDAIPLLAKNKDVLWIPGWRLSEDVRLTEESRKALIIETCLI